METDKIETYKAFLVQRGIGEGSVKNYVFCLKKYSLIYPVTITGLTNCVLTYKAKYRYSYINKTIFAIRLYATCFNLAPELQNYKPLKRQAFAKATMSVDEIIKFLTLEPIKNEDRKLHAYWTLFFRIASSTGMRLGEIAHLKIDDLDFGRQVFVLQETKTGYPRNVPIPKSLVQDLEVYVRNSRVYVFESPRYGGLPNDAEWNYMFHKRIKRLGIARKNLTPYSLRHSFITRMLEEDVNIFKVQKIVGHSNIATTAGYTHLTTKDIVKAISKDPLEMKNDTPEDVLLKTATLIQTLVPDFAKCDLRHLLDVSASHIRFELWKP